MKKTLSIFIGLILLNTSFCQKTGLGGEDFEKITNLKTSKLYIYLTKEFGENSNNPSVNQKVYLDTKLFYKEMIEKHWNFCDYEFIDKEKYKLLKKDKNNFFLTNVLGYASTNTNSGHNPRNMNSGSDPAKMKPTTRGASILMLSKGKPKLKTIKKRRHVFAIKYRSINYRFPFTYITKYRESDFNKSGKRPSDFTKEYNLKMGKDRIVTEIKLINNYLNDCMKYGTAEIHKIAKNNAPYLKGKNIGLFRSFSLTNFSNKDIKEVNSIKNVNILFAKSANLTDLVKKDFTKKYFSEYLDKDIYWLTNTFNLTKVILDEQSRICFYHVPKGLKINVKLEHLLKFADDVGK